MRHASLEGDPRQANQNQNLVSIMEYVSGCRNVALHFETDIPEGQVTESERASSEGVVAESVADLWETIFIQKPQRGSRIHLVEK